MFFDEIRGISDRLTSLSLEGNDNLGDKNVQVLLVALFYAYLLMYILHHAPVYAYLCLIMCKYSKVFLL